jgi:hypothetical protein
MLFDQIIAISHYPRLLALPRSARERSSSSAPALGPLCFKRDHQQFRNGNGKRRSPASSIAAHAQGQSPNLPACNGFEQILAGVHHPLTQKQVRDSVRMRASDVSQPLATLIANGRVIKSADG